MAPVPTTACDASSIPARDNRSSNNSSVDSIRRCGLYINLTVKDPSEAVQRKVGKKIEQCSLPRPIKAIAKRSAPRLAREVATPAAVAGQVSRKLAEKIPRKLAQRGIEADAVPVYHRGPYVVMRITVRRVDVLRFVNSRDVAAVAPAPLTKTSSNSDEPGGEAAVAVPPSHLPAVSSSSPATTLTVAMAFRELWDAVIRRGRRQEVGEARADIGELWPKFLTAVWVLMFALAGSRKKEWLESTVLPLIVQRRIVRSLQDLLDAKLERKRLVADGVVLNETDQCRYFYSQISRLDDDLNDGMKGIGVALPQQPAKQIAETIRSRTVARQILGTSSPN
jgi:hypothetical protein